MVEDVMEHMTRSETVISDDEAWLTSMSIDDIGKRLEHWKKANVKYLRRVSLMQVVKDMSYLMGYVREMK
jgi:hypothetical protein